DSVSRCTLAPTRTRKSLPEPRIRDHRGAPTKPASPQNKVPFGNPPASIMSITCARSLAFEGPKRQHHGSRSPICQSNVIQTWGFGGVVGFFLFRARRSPRDFFFPYWARFPVPYFGAQNAASLERVRGALLRDPSNAIGTHGPIRQNRPPIWAIRSCKT